MRLALIEIKPSLVEQLIQWQSEYFISLYYLASASSMLVAS